MKSGSKTAPYSVIQQNLADACEWAGVAQGRVRDYQRHLEQSHVENTHSRETILSTADILDILDIWKFWKIYENNFPGIRNKIRRVIEKGPILQEDENIKISDNRARNDLFVYFLPEDLSKRELKFYRLMVWLEVIIGQFLTMGILFVHFRMRKLSLNVNAHKS